MRLSGYGGFNISVLRPTVTALNAAWLKLGGVHEAATKTRRQNAGVRRGAIS